MGVGRVRVPPTDRRSAKIARRARRRGRARKGSRPGGSPGPAAAAARVRTNLRTRSAGPGAQAGTGAPEASSPCTSARRYTGPSAGFDSAARIAIAPPSVVV